MKEKVKCLIIDDEQNARENLRLLLDSYCSNVEVVGEAHDEGSIKKLLAKTNADLVFLDIQIGPNTIFDILNELDEIKFSIVFVSAYDEYALEGYKYDALDYLLKPIDVKQLVEVVEKTKKVKNEETSLSKKQRMTDYKEFYENIVDSPKVSIVDNKGVHVLKENDIIYCAGEGNYTTIFLNEKKEFIISKNLKQVAIKLSPKSFARVHKSYLINVNNMNFIQKQQGGAIVMSNGKTIPISRSYRKSFFERLNII